MLKDKKEIGELIKKYRTTKSMTQNELAKLLHVSNSAISNWENGETSIEIDLLDKLADLMGITLDELIRKQDFKNKYMIYEHIQLNGLNIEFSKIFFGSATTVELLFKNTTNNPIDLTGLKYNLVDGISNVLREKTKLFTDYDEEIDDMYEIKTTEKLSNIPSFIEPKGQVKISLIFENVLNFALNYKLSIYFNQQSRTFLLPSFLLRVLYENNSMIEIIKKNNYTDEEINQLIQYFRFIKNEEQVVNIIKAQYEILPIDILKRYEYYPITEEVFDLFRTNIDQISLLKSMDESFEIGLITFINDEYKLNELIIKNKDKIEEIDAANSSKLFSLYKRKFWVLNKENQEFLFSLFAKINHNDTNTTIFDYNLNHFIRQGNITNLYQSIDKYSSDINYKLIVQLLNDKVLKDDVLKLLDNKNVLLSNKEIIALINNFCLKSEEPFYSKLLNLLQIHTKEDFYEIKGIIKREDILKNMIDKDIINYSYLV